MLAQQQRSSKRSVPTLRLLPPPLKWAGGKRWLVPKLTTIWQKHSHRRLVEPFVGGMAVYLGLRPERALLNDVNSHLINFYRWLKRGLTATLEMRNEHSCYYAHRDRFNELIHQDKITTSEAAILFYYLNRTGFNGLCRFNNSGYYNVPFGKYKTIHYLDTFSKYQYALAPATFKSTNFSMLPIKAHDFIYADPPYDVEFTSYSAGGFSWSDQVRLADWLAAHPGPVVASNQATPRIIDLYKAHGFIIEQVEAPRRIACSGDRTPAIEILAMKDI